MKKLILFSIILLGLVMCNTPVKNGAGSEKTTISIYYFHGTNRCGNCMAIEENTQKALSQYFPDKVGDGTIKFTSVNVDEAANKSLVEKCDASAMMLYIVKTDAGGDESKTDFSEFAINTARSKPDAYMIGIRDRITELMK